MTKTMKTVSDQAGSCRCNLTTVFCADDLKDVDLFDDDMAMGSGQEDSTGLRGMPGTSGLQGAQTPQGAL